MDHTFLVEIIEFVSNVTFLNFCNGSNIGGNDQVKKSVMKKAPCTLRVTGYGCAAV